MTHHQLEHDLRAALRAEADAVVAPEDAWQRNQRRLSEARSRRTSRLMSTAAAVVLVVLVGGLLALVTRGPDDGSSITGGGDDPFRTEYQLGPPVPVETTTIDGTAAVHEAVLSDRTGQGPQLCDRVESRSGGSGAGGCTSLEPDFDGDAVAIDWLTGNSGSGDIRGVLAGVDARVQKVEIWMSNGDMTLADLKPSGWEGTKLFALTTPADGPRAQRLVAYAGASGAVLQAVDLGELFGSDWLAEDPGCSIPGDVVRVPGASVWGGAHEAMLTQYSNGSVDREKCVSLTATLQGVTAGATGVVVVVAPEVARVEVSGRGGTVAASTRPPAALPPTMWRVLGLSADRDLEPSDVVTAYDAKGNELDEIPVAGLS